MTNEHDAHSRDDKPTSGLFNRDLKYDSAIRLLRNMLADDITNIFSEAKDNGDDPYRAVALFIFGDQSDANRHLAKRLCYAIAFTV